jgi:HK97 family phage major capsid protein
MFNLRELREKRSKKVDEAKSLFAKAKAENRSLSPEEKTQHDNLIGEIDTLDEDIKRAQRQEDLDKEEANRSQPLNTHNTTEVRDLNSYSLLKAARSQAGLAKLDGLELEMHQEAEKEARAAGQAVDGVGSPRILISRRDNSITMPTQPEDGSAIVETTHRPVLDLLRPNLTLRQLGATFLTGLTGNISSGSLSEGAVSEWEDEVAEVKKSNQKFATEGLAPKRLGTKVHRSKQFLLQTDPSVEAMLRRDLENSIMLAVERAAINGDGVKKPLGILNTPGIGAVSIGANGGVPTRDLLIALATEVEDNDIPMTSPGFLLNVRTKAKLKSTKVDAGSGIFLMNSNNELDGYPAYASNLVPKNITKGTGTNLSAAIFGNWADLLIGQWGGMDLVVDPYTLASNGQYRIVIQAYFDTLLQRVKSFAAVKDIITTLGE